MILLINAHTREKLVFLMALAIVALPRKDRAN
jgi:hypothetical protein